MSPLASTLATISKHDDLQVLSQQPNVIIQVSCLIDRLRGAARATLPRSQSAIFDVGAAVMEPLLVLMRTYNNHVRQTRHGLVNFGKRIYLKLFRFLLSPMLTEMHWLHVSISLI